MTNDPNKQIIFILDDEQAITNMLQEYINRKLSDIDVYIFSTCSSMLNHPLINECSLFIIDIELNADAKGNEVAAELFKNKFNKPYLFMSGKSYDFECFQQYDYTYDFIKKPFDLNKLLNRISVLLKVSDTYRLHEIEERKLKFSLKEVFDYTNIYMVILDSDMTIKTCSYKLAKDLEYNNYKDIVGLSWKQFIKEKDTNKIKMVHDNIVNNTEKYNKSLREVTSTLITKSGKTISVKWFNSRIKNGHISTFSIGIPYNRKVTANDEVDSIRAYWKHVLDKDETTLSALKSIL